MQSNGRSDGQSQADFTPEDQTFLSVKGLAHLSCCTSCLAVKPADTPHLLAEDVLAHGLVDQTLAFADPAGKRHLNSGCNPAHDDRVVPILVDHPQRVVLKVLGRLTVQHLLTQDDLASALVGPTFRARPRRAMPITAKGVDQGLARRHHGPMLQPSEPPRRDPQTYATADSQPLWLDVIGAQPGACKPAVMWIHGGGLIFGSRTTSPRPAFLQLLLARGFVVFAIDHRLAPETQLPSIVDDVLQAWQWVTTEGAARFGADPARTVIAGASAGAYLSLLAAPRATPRPRALAAFWGFGDILAPWETEPSAHYRQFDLVTPEAARDALATSPVQRAGIEVDRSLFYLWCRQKGQWVQQVTGLHPQHDAAELDRWCPLRHIDPAFPPTVLVHGQADTDVPHEQSALLAAALAQRGVVHRFVSLPGAGHGFAGAQVEEAEAAEAAVVDFLLQAIASTPQPG